MLHLHLHLPLPLPLRGKGDEGRRTKYFVRSTLGRSADLAAIYETIEGVRFRVSTMHNYSVSQQSDRLATCLGSNVSNCHSLTEHLTFGTFSIINAHCFQAIWQRFKGNIGRA